MESVTRSLALAKQAIPDRWGRGRGASHALFGVGKTCDSGPPGGGPRPPWYALFGVGKTSETGTTVTRCDAVTCHGLVRSLALAEHAKSCTAHEPQQWLK